MAIYPRYLTYKAGELEAALQRLGAPQSVAQDLRAGGSGSASRRLLQSHACAVAYPDGTTGVCSYTRAAAKWRVFRYEYLAPDGKPGFLPAQYLTERIADDPEAVTAAAERLAVSAFFEAMRRERDLFRRATSPYGAYGAKPTQKPQMAVRRAKEKAGRYALCRPLGPDGGNLLPVSDAFDTLEAANAAWLAQADRLLVVGCCSRWLRRWERPRLNPLHARPDYPPLPKVPTAAPGSVSPVPAAPSEAADPEDDWGDDIDEEEDEAEEEDAPQIGSDFVPEPEGQEGKEGKEGT